MPVRPQGNLIIGGQVFQIDAPVVNWHENGWDATSELCLPTKDNTVAKCTPAGPGKMVPYGKLPFGAYTRRYSTRPALRNSKWNGGMNAPYEAAKNVIKKFVIHHDGCGRRHVLHRAAERARAVGALPAR